MLCLSFYIISLKTFCETFFNSEAIERAKLLSWNAETREIESADDVYLTDGGDGLDDFDLVEAPDKGPSNDHDSGTPPMTAQVERLFYGEDTDSIGTLFTTNQNGTVVTNSQHDRSLANTTPITQNRSGRLGGSSVGGQSLGMTFTNEEASQQIILLTERLGNIELMFLAVIQQQGISLPHTLTNPSRNNINMTTLQRGPIIQATSDSNQMAVDDIQEVDHESSVVNRDPL
jgi:hypothetical protein